MTDTITNLLNIQDEDVIITLKEVSNNTKIFEISKVPHPVFCPVCQSRMHSKGVRTRSVKHQVLQDGYQLLLEVKQRRWICTNESCRQITSDEFTFLSPGRRTAVVTKLMIVNAFRNI